MDRLDYFSASKLHKVVQLDQFHKMERKGKFVD